MNKFFFFFLQNEVNHQSVVLLVIKDRIDRSPLHVRPLAVSPALVRE